MNARVAVSKPVTEIVCPVKKANLSILNCMDKYVDANALRRKHSACYRCRVGEQARVLFAQS